jgi:hypothetical protein
LRNIVGNITTGYSPVFSILLYTLVSLKKYYPIGRLAFAMLFFIASSGFTMVLHSCLMESGECCESMEDGGSVQLPAGQSAAKPHFVQTGASCCHNIIVGGLNHTSATLENQSSSTYHKSTIAIISPDVPAGQIQSVHPTFLALQQISSHVPPATGLYLSNAALLI